MIGLDLRIPLNMFLTGRPRNMVRGWCIPSSGRFWLMWSRKTFVLFSSLLWPLYTFLRSLSLSLPLGTGDILKVYETFRRGFGCLLIFWCTFSLRPVSNKLGRFLSKIFIKGYRLIRFERYWGHCQYLPWSVLQK